MKILVFIKQAVNSQRPGLTKDNTLDRSTSEKVINPADLNALEEALKMKDLGGSKVIVCTMGPDSAADLLLRAGAMGADDLYLISDSRLAGSDTLSTARVLYRTVRKLDGCDLIFCGRRSIDGETGQVGPELAAMLNIPNAVNCTGISLEGRKVVCDILMEHEVKKISLPLPSLITFYNSINSPRLPSIKGLRNVKMESVNRLCSEDLGLKPENCGLKGSPTRVINMKQNIIKRRTPVRLELFEGIKETKRFCNVE